jgi:hypothetical protein
LISASASSSIGWPGAGKFPGNDCSCNASIPAVET